MKLKFYYDLFGIFLISCTIFDKSFYLLGILLFTIQLVLINNYNINRKFIILGIVLSLYYFFRLIYIETTISSEILIFRNYYGWLFFLIFYSSRFDQIKDPISIAKYFLYSLNFIFLLMTIFNILEVSFPSLQLFQNIYSDQTQDRIFGMTGRPSSTSAVIACIFLINLQCKNLFKIIPNNIFYIITLLTFINMYLLGSGVGVFIIFIGFFIQMILIYKNRSKTILYFLVFLLILTSFCIFSMDILMTDLSSGKYQFAGFERLNKEYISILLHMKSELINSYFDSAESIMLGSSPESPEFGSDFGFGLYFYYFGILGIFLQILIMVIFIKSSSVLCILLLLISNLHYPTTTGAIGSMLFAMIVSWGIIASRFNINNASRLVI